MLYYAYSRHIAGKNEKEYKRKQKRVIYVFKRLSVNYKECSEDNDKSYPERNNSEYNNNRKCEKQKINDRSPSGKTKLFVFKSKLLGFYKYDTANRYQYN